MAEELWQPPIEDTQTTWQPPAEDLDIPYTPRSLSTSPSYGGRFGGFGSGGVANSKAFLAETSLGRIMDAIGLGAKENWGSEPIGLSEENKLRLMTGDLNPESKEWLKKPFTVGGAYTEMIVQPVAAILDTLFRAPQAAVGGLASGAQQAAIEWMPEKLFNILSGGASKRMFSTDPKDNVADPAYVAEFNNQIGAALAFATFPDPVFAGLKPVPPAPMLNRQKAFADAMGDVDTPLPKGPVTPGVPDPMRPQMPLDVLTKKAETVEQPGAPRVGKDDKGFKVEWNDPKYGNKFEARSDAEGKPFATEADAQAFALAKSQKLGYSGVASQVAKEEIPIVPERLMPKDSEVPLKQRLETAKDIDVNELGEAGSLEGQVLAINPDLVMYNQYGTKTSMIDIDRLSEVTGVPVDALIKRDSPYSSLDPVQSIKLEKAFTQMADEVTELGRKVVDEASAMTYLQARQKLIQSLVDVERKDYLKGLALKAEQAVSKVEKLKNRAIATFFRDQDFEGAFTPDGKLTDAGLLAIQKEANEVRKINSAAGVNQYLRKKTKDQAGGFYSKSRDMGLEYLYNWGMLSSPKTHAANMISNTLVAMLRVSETGLAGGIGGVRSLFTKADDRVYMGEAYQKAFGLIQGMPEGFKAAYKAFALEEPTFGKSNKVEINKKAVPGILGKGVRAPGNLMMAEDEFFKAMAYRASINSQAYREAVKKGLTGQKFVNHIAKRVANPTDDMRTQAYKEADYDTFTKELGSTGKKIEALGREWPIAKFLTFPFMRTPTNIFKFMGERTPLSLASQNVRDTLIGKYGKAARDEQVAKMLIGSTVMYLGFKWASQGTLTGNGPKDPVERAQWLGDGNQPNSMLVDGEWHRLDRLGPLASILSASADTNYIWDKRGKAAYEKLEAGDMPTAEELADMNILLMVAAGNVVNQLPLVNGINDLSDAFNEDDGYKLQKLFINFTSRAVPAIGADIAKVNDLYINDIKTLQDAFNSRIPWKVDEVPDMLDTFGQPIPNTMQGWGNLLNPVQHKDARSDPVFKAMEDVGYNMARPNKSIGGVELTREQYREYWQLSGTASRIALADLISSIPDWETIPKGVRKELMVNTVRDIRDKTARMIKAKYFGSGPTDILQQMMQNKLNMFAPINDE